MIYYLSCSWSEIKQISAKRRSYNQERYKDELEQIVQKMALKLVPKKDYMSFLKGNRKEFSKFLTKIIKNVLKVEFETKLNHNFVHILTALAEKNLERVDFFSNKEKELFAIYKKVK